MAKTYNRLEIDVNKKPNSIGIRPVQNDAVRLFVHINFQTIIRFCHFPTPFQKSH